MYYKVLQSIAQYHSVLQSTTRYEYFSGDRTAEDRRTPKVRFEHRTGWWPSTHSIGKFFLWLIGFLPPETSAPGRELLVLYTIQCTNIYDKQYLLLGPQNVGSLACSSTRPGAALENPWRSAPFHQWKMQLLLENCTAFAHFRVNP